MSKRLLVHLVLFLLTAFSTYMVQGPSYGVCLMSILTAHELGHYFASRRHGMNTSLPFFLPSFLPPFGTFGAVIRMRGSIPNKRALFDMGVAGPLCGFLLAVPCVIVGLKFSALIRVVGPAPLGTRFGESLLLKLLERLVIGCIPPHYDVLIHPVGFAGYAGLFVTAFNLLPIGQLDGGHILYAVLGEKSKWVYRAAILFLIIAAFFYSAGWLVLVLLLAIFGIHHPRLMEPHTPLDPKRKVLAAVIFLVFVASFVPAPIAGMSLKELLIQNRLKPTQVLPPSPTLPAGARGSSQPPHR